MNAEMITAVVRHVLTAVGGAMAVSWGIDGATWEGVAAALATLAGLGWSIADKRRRSK